MKSLGERGIIKVLTSAYRSRKRLPLDYDDDVSAVPVRRNTWLVLKCDMLVGSTDVPPGMSGYDTGWRAVVATVSDFAAKGVKPLALMASIGLPAGTPRSQVSSIGRGIGAASRMYDCPVVGGDTSEAKDLVIDIIGCGTTRPTRLVRRTGARSGDIIAVTGAFGNSAAGLRYLVSTRKPKLEGVRVLERAVKRPRARLNEGLRLARSRVLTSSIDSSDGLAWSLHELASLNNVSIHLDQIPIAPQAREYSMKAGFSPIDLALYGGEEYELVLTIRPQQFEKAKKLVPSLVRIGMVSSGPPAVKAEIQGKEFQIEARGWEHFKN